MTDDDTSWAETLETQLENGTFNLSSWTDVVSIQQLIIMMKLANVNPWLFQALIGVGSIGSNFGSVTTAQATVSPSTVVVNITGTLLNLPASVPVLTATMFPGLTTNDNSLRNQ